MPTINGKYAMNPGVARRRASEAEPDDDDYTNQADAADNDTDDDFPPDHELESLRVEPASNGFTVTHHTRLTKKGRAKRERMLAKSKGKETAAMPMSDDYRGKSKVFESSDRAVGHVAKVLKKHQSRRG